MYIQIKKNWLYVILTLFAILLTCFLIWYVYVSFHNPIQVTLKSTNPLLRNITLNKNLVTNALEKYQYTVIKNTYFIKRPTAERYKKITIILVPEEQPRFAYKTEDKLFSGSSSIEALGELTIKLYLSEEYIKKWYAKKDISYLQRMINRLFILELYVNSPQYKALIRRTSGMPSIQNLGNQPPKEYIVIKQ